MNPYVILVFNIIILAALAATILYAWKLSRQFRDMQADRKPFEKLIEALNNAASRADAATRALKETAIRDGERLQEKISAARGFAEELEIVIQAGDTLAARLETLALKASRGGAEPQKKTSGEQAYTLREEALALSRLPANEKPEKPVRTRAERELLEALRAKQRSS